MRAESLMIYKKDAPRPMPMLWPGLSRRRAKDTRKMPRTPYVGGRQGFPRTCVKDLSAYDVYRLLGMRSPDTGHPRQHGNKNQFAEHGKYGKSIRIDTKYRYEATNRKTVGGLCFGGIEARSMPRGKSRPKDRKDYGRPRSVAMSTRRSSARARFATSANCATVASSSARRTRVVRSPFASRSASANCSRGTRF